MTFGPAARPPGAAGWHLGAKAKCWN